MKWNPFCETYKHTAGAWYQEQDEQIQQQQPTSDYNDDDKNEMKISVWYLWFCLVSFSVSFFFWISELVGCCGMSRTCRVYV